MLAKLRIPLIALLGLFIFASVVMAASSRVELTDGTVLVGEVKQIGASYSITMPDGSKKLVSAKQIKTIDGKPIGGAPAAGSGAAASGDKPAAGAGTPAGTSGTANASAAFTSTKSKADRCEQPITAVDLWQRFLKDFPDSPDVAKAKAELEVWQKRYEDKAELIKRQWVGGKDLEKLKKEVAEIVAEGMQFERDNQFNKAQKKYEEAIAKYPNDFIANSQLGYFLLVNSNGRPDRYDASIKCLETARTVDSSGPEVWANLAAAYSLRRRHVEAIKCADKALKILTDPDLVAQLVGVVGNAPRGIYLNNPEIREIIDNNNMTVRDGGGGGGGGGLKYFQPGFFDAKRAASGKPPAQDPDDPNRTGMLWSGSGFFVSDDGYFITNHHVATGEPKKPVDPSLSFRVRLSRTDGRKGEEFPATLIAVGEKCDIALMKVEFPDKRKVPFLKIAQENPPPASKALVLGYPATGDGEHSLQVVDGTVKSIHPESEHHVWFDLSTTHGNSGGPIVDAEGNVIGILTAGQRVYDINYVYGVGPHQIKEFIDDLISGGKSASEVPAMQYVPRAATRPQFDGEKLAEVCTPKTVLVLAMRAEPAKGGDRPKPDGAGKKPGGGDGPKDGGDKPGGGDKPDEGGKAPGGGAGGAATGIR
jgi:S1-C subfamily serine protease